jgi:hypothetical protein
MTTGDLLTKASTGNHAKPGFVPTDDDLYWISTMRAVVVDTMRAGHTAALMVVIAALVGWVLVAGALAFDAAPGLWNSSTGVIIWILPLAAWTSAMFFALRVFSIRRYRYFSNSPDSARQAIVRIARRKNRALHWALAFWLGGVVLFLLALLFGNFGRS